MDDIDDCSRQVARTIDDVVLRSFELPWEDALHEFDALHDILLPQAPSSETRLETQRRIAEAKLTVLFDRGIPMAAFEQIWADLSMLGFTNEEREASMNIFRIKYLVAVHAPASLVQGAMSDFQSVICRMREKGDSLMADEFSQVYERLESKLPKA